MNRGPCRQEYLFLILITLSFMSCSHNQLISTKEQKDAKVVGDFLPSDYPDAKEVNKWLASSYSSLSHKNYEPVLEQKEGLWYQFWGDMAQMITIHLNAKEDSCDMRLTRADFDYWLKDVKSCSTVAGLSNLEAILSFDGFVYKEDRKGFWYHDTWMLIKMDEGKHKLKDFFNDEDRKRIKDTQAKVTHLFVEKISERLLKNVDDSQ